MPPALAEVPLIPCLLDFPRTPGLLLSCVTHTSYASILQVQWQLGGGRVVAPANIAGSAARAS